MRTRRTTRPRDARPEFQPNEGRDSNARWTVRPPRSLARDRGTACDQSKRASGAAVRCPSGGDCPTSVPRSRRL
jgi:hypothetical protein